MLFRADQDAKVILITGYHRSSNQDLLAIFELMADTSLSSNNKRAVLAELQQIPGTGKACSLDLWNIGIRSIAELKGKNPARLYAQLNQVTGAVHDICMLYTFRCAVYFATEKKHDEEKLKWWYWKDRTYNE